MADTMIITETAADGSTIEIQVIEASEDSTSIEDVIEALSGETDEADADESPETETSGDHTLAAGENDTEDDSTVWVDDDGNAVDTFEATAPTGDHLPGVMTVDEAYEQINNNHGGGIGMSVDEAYASLGHSDFSELYALPVDDAAWEQDNVNSHEHYAADYSHAHDTDSDTSTE